MSLFSATFSATEADYNNPGFEAGNAEEMETKIRNHLSGGGTPDLVADLVIGGAGAGPKWQAYLVLADAVASGASVAVGSALVAAAVAGNPEEARLKVLQKLATLAPTNIHKVVVGGGGVGPTYMAIALGS